jgi:hypothetical protein
MYMQAVDESLGNLVVRYFANFMHLVERLKRDGRAVCSPHPGYCGLTDLRADVRAAARA